MMKFYDDLTELNSKDVSAKSLKRLRTLTYFSLPFTPILGMMETEFMFGSVLAIPLLIVFLVSIVAMGILGFSKLSNRVWVRDKYLESWELKMKHRSLAYSLQVMVWTAIGAMLVGYLLYTFNLFVWPEIKPVFVGYAFFAFLMLGLYSQVFAQLAMLESMEEHEFAWSDNRRPVPNPAGGTERAG